MVNGYLVKRDEGEDEEQAASPTAEISAAVAESHVVIGNDAQVGLDGFSGGYLRFSVGKHVCMFPISGEHTNHELLLPGPS